MPMAMGLCRNGSAALLRSERREASHVQTEMSLTISILASQLHFGLRDGSAKATSAKEVAFVLRVGTKATRATLTAFWQGSTDCGGQLPDLPSLAAPTKTNAMTQGVAFVLRHACRVPFCTTQSPCLRPTVAPSSSSSVISPEMTTP